MIISLFIGILGFLGQEGPQDPFIEEVFRAHFEKKDLDPLVKQNPDRTFSLVFDLLRSAPRPGAQKHLLEVAKNLAPSHARVTGHAILSEALNRYRALDDSGRSLRVQFEERLAGAVAAMQKQDLDAALRLGEEALSLAQGTGESYLIARANHLVANLLWQRGGPDLDPSLGRAREARKIDRDLGARRELREDFDLLRNIHFSLGNFPAALDNGMAALTLARAQGDEEQVFHQQEKIIPLYSFLGKQGEALLEVERGLELARTRKDSLREGIFLSMRGDLAGASGRYGQAVEFKLDAMRVWEGKQTNRLRRARLHRELAGIYSEIGMATDALGEVDQALRLLQEDGPESDLGRERAKTWTSQALIFLDQEKVEAALGVLAKARAESRGQTMDWTGLEVDRLRARALQQTGRLEEALAIWESLAAHPEMGHPFWQSFLCTEIGKNKELQGNATAARRWYTQATDLDWDASNPEAFWRAWSGLGRLALQEGNLPEARKNFTMAVDYLEALRGNLRAPALQIRYLGDKLEIYRDLAWIHAKTGNAVQAFQVSEMAKARVLLDLTVERELESQPFDHLPPEIRNPLLAAETRLRMVEQGIAAGNRVGNWETILQEARGEVHRWRIQAEIKSAREERLVGRVARVRWSEIQKALPEATVLVDFVIRKKGSFALLLSRDRLVFEDLGVTAQDLERNIQALLQPIEDLRKGRVDLANLGFDGAAAHQLYQFLIAPLADRLEGFHRWIVVADGPLRRLPLGMLVRERHPQPVDPALLFSHHRGNRYLAEEVQITYLPVAGLLLQDSRQQPAPALGYFLARSSQGGAEDLPQTAQEVALAGVWNQGGETRIHLGKEASEANWKQTAPHSGWIHLATHASLDDSRPAFSRLSLAPSETEDGFLHAFEVERMRLRASSVVLSACETMGSVGRGEGLLGLARAFLLAGAQNVLASAWAVDDGATGALMGRYYHLLAQGRSPSLALQGAQIHLLRQAGREGISYAHPFFWAGFLHIGN